MTSIFEYLIDSVQRNPLGSGATSTVYTLSGLQAPFGLVLRKSKDLYLPDLNPTKTALYPVSNPFGEISSSCSALLQTSKDELSIRRRVSGKPFFKFFTKDHDNYQNVKLDSSGINAYEEFTKNVTDEKLIDIMLQALAIDTAGYAIDRNKTNLLYDGEKFTIIDPYKGTKSDPYTTIVGLLVNFFLAKNPEDEQKLDEIKSRFESRLRSAYEYAQNTFELPETTILNCSRVLLSQPLADLTAALNSGFYRL